MGSTVPAGYLICNGSAVSRTAYDKLFQAIGTKYGEGDGSTTFNLPNLIDRFLQGSETSGTIKDAGLPNITGGFGDLIGDRGHWSGGSGCFSNARREGQCGQAQGSFWNFVDFDFDASRSSPIYGNSETVQPPSVTSIPCIKAFDSVIDATTVSVAQLSDTKVNKAGDTMTGSLTAPSFIANGIDCSVDSQGDGYIRYSSGLQICWGVTKAFRCDIGGAVYFTISYNVFNSNPSLSLTRFNEVSGWSQIQCIVKDITTTYAYVKVYNNGVMNVSGQCQYFWQAIGRWK